MKINLNIEAEKQHLQEKEEDLYTRLCRLAATWDGLCDPVKDIHHMFYNNRTNPYPNMAQEAAWEEFERRCKEYQREQTMSNSLESLRKQSAISVGPTYIANLDTKETIPIVAGDLQYTYTDDQAIARDVANILTVYTQCEQRNMFDKQGVKRTVDVVTGLDSKQQRTAMLYSMDAIKVRKTYPFLGGSVITTRDGIYSDLTSELRAQGEDAKNRRNKQRAINYMLMDDLASQVAADYRVEMDSKWVECFNNNRQEGLKPRQTMYRFDFSCFKVLKCKDHEKVWKTCLRVGQHTGSSKSNIFAGYSLMDTLPGYGKQLEEAMDIINCARLCSYDAVRFTVANSVLSQILVGSGLTVYCTTYGTGIQIEQSPVGIYYDGPRRAMTWMPGGQKKHPEIKQKSVNFPDPVQMYNDNTFAYEYIPRAPEGSKWYLPSMKAAFGLCIKTNVDVSTKYLCTIDNLVERFYMAIATRCQYLYTRITFPMIDPMGDFFSAAVVLPQKDAEDEVVGFEALATMAERIRLNPDAATKWFDNSAPDFPLTSVVEHNTLLEDPPQSVDRKSNEEIAKEYLAFLADSNFKVGDLMAFFHSWAHNRPVPELSKFTSVLSKKNILEGLVLTAKIPKSVRISDVGDVEYLQKAKWRKFIEMDALMAPPPPLDTHKTPPPQEEDDDDSPSGDPYASGSKAQVKKKIKKKD